MSAASNKPKPRSPPLRVEKTEYARVYNNNKRRALRASPPPSPRAGRNPSLRQVGTTGLAYGS